MISTTRIPLFHGHGGSSWTLPRHVTTFPAGVRCPSAEVAVPDHSCGHRIKLFLMDGEPLRCKGPKCPRWPREIRV
jgi:hypothetical protein